MLRNRLEHNVPRRNRLGVQLCSSIESTITFMTFDGSVKSHRDLAPADAKQPSLSGNGLNFKMRHGSAQGGGLDGFAQHVNVMDGGLVCDS
jgi:hypothetical protein